MLNLVWDEVQDESSRNSQPHIGSDGAGTTHFPYISQELPRFFCLKRLGLTGFGVVVVAFAICHSLKPLIDRVRPEWQNTTGGLDSPAFPSGHATGAAAIAGVLIVLVGMLIRRAGMRALFRGLLVLYILLVCADRLLLGRHFVGDVVGGVLPVRVAAHGGGDGALRVERPGGACGYGLTAR